MINALEQVFRQSWQRLGEQVALLFPNVLAMLLILGGGWVIARLAQWMLLRMSVRLETTLRRWGVSLVMDSLGRGGGAELCARGVFWLILAGALLMGVNALDTEVSSRLVAGAFLFLPNLLTAGVVVLVGFLLGRFLARGALIWAVNEGIGSARWIATGVRVGVGLLTVVAAAEQLGVARTAVLVTYVVLLSATALGLAIALALGCRKRVEQWLDRREAFLQEVKKEQPIDHV